MIPLILLGAAYLIEKSLQPDTDNYHLGGDMSKHLAPNGKPSKLTHEQWHLVRTPAFKAWFGDWEKSPETASKVVDENGEPLVCYHTDNYPCDSERHKIKVFDIEQKYEKTKLITPSGKAFYFSFDIGLALEFSRCNYELAKYRLYKIFLNVRNPSNEKEYAFSFEDKININDSIKREKKCDGVFLHNIFFDSELGDNIDYADQIVVFYPNQIKLADGTNTTFDGGNPDIRLKKGGRTIAQTPSPKKDRIYGSKVNAKGSASSEKSASKIKLSKSITESLSNKLSEFKKESKKDNVSLNDLKAVYRRGLGAYSSSHRPTISGGKPNTRNAWAMARVNKFLLKASGEKVKKAYIQDDDLL